MNLAKQRKKIRAILKQLKEPDSMNRIYHLVSYLKQQEKEKSKWVWIKKSPARRQPSRAKQKNIQLNYITISKQSKVDYTDVFNDIEMYLARAEAAINEVVGEFQDSRTTTFALIANDYLGKIREIVESAME